VEQKRNRTTLSQVGGLPGEAIDGGPAWSVNLVRGAAAVAILHWLSRVAVCRVARGRPGIPARVRAGLGKCHGTATCVRNPRPGERPDGKRGSSSVPGCGPTSKPAHGTPAGCTWESAKKFLLRDHAPPQSQAASALVAKKGCADGARVRPRHAVIWRPRPGAAWPAASPPANAAPTASIQDLGNNADSNAAVGTCVHSLCAGRRASAVVGNGSLAYQDDGPREHVHKGQPG